MILAFHFELKHVPGKVHGPDGLSWQPPQLDDESGSEDEEDFNDWINNVYGFVHMIKNLVPAPKSTQYHYTLAGEIAMQTYDMDEPLITELNYNLMLCNAAAVLVDKHLEMVHCSDQAAMIRMLTIFLFPSFPSPIPTSVYLCTISSYACHRYLLLLTQMCTTHPMSHRTLLTHMYLSTSFHDSLSRLATFVLT